MSKNRNILILSDNDTKSNLLADIFYRYCANKKYNVLFSSKNNLQWLDIHHNKIKQKKKIPTLEKGNNTYINLVNHKDKIDKWQFNIRNKEVLRNIIQPNKYIIKENNKITYQFSNIVDICDKYVEMSNMELVLFINEENLINVLFIMPLLVENIDNIISKKVIYNECLEYNEFCPEFLDNVNSDIWRYCILKSDFLNSQELVSNNNDLVHTFQDYSSKIINFCNTKYHMIPEKGEYLEKEILLIDKINLLIGKYYIQIENANLAYCLDLILELVKLGSIYFSRNKCEKLHIDEPYRCKTVMNLSCNILIHIAYLINPIMPKYSKSILDSFNIEEVNVNNYLVFISHHKIKKANILFEII